MYKIINISLLEDVQADSLNQQLIIKLELNLFQKINKFIELKVKYKDNNNKIITNKKKFWKFFL